MQASSNASTFEWLILSILCTSSHQTWHLILSELDLLSAKGSEGKVSDLYRYSNQHMSSMEASSIRTLNLEAGADMIAV
jgi:hypothetical protein